MSRKRLNLGFANSVGNKVTLYQLTHVKVSGPKAALQMSLSIKSRKIFAPIFPAKNALFQIVLSAVTTVLCAFLKPFEGYLRTRGLEVNEPSRIENATIERLVDILINPTMKTPQARLNSDSTQKLGKRLGAREPLVKRQRVWPGA